MVEVLKIPQDRANAVDATPYSLKSKSKRKLVWSRLKQIPKNKGFFISEDFPKSVIFSGKKLLPVFSEARNVLGKKDTSLKGHFRREVHHQEPAYSSWGSPPKNTQ